MTQLEMEKYCKVFNVHRVEKSCGTCKHFQRSYEEAGCHHPNQAEFDAWEQALRKDGAEPNTYGPWGGGILVDEGFVCDLWAREE